MNRTDNALVEETRALIQEVESGDTAHAAWVAIQDRVQRLCEGRTQTEVASLVGKSQTWVSELLSWDYRDHDKPTPKAGPRKPEWNQATAKKVLADPEQRTKVIESFTEEERIEIAQAVMAPEMRNEVRGQKERDRKSVV